MDWQKHPPFQFGLQEVKCPTCGGVSSFYINENDQVMNPKPGCEHFKKLWEKMETKNKGEKNGN